jgi:AraC-like DNA-binding protein
MLFPERPIQAIHMTWKRRVAKSFDMHFGLELGIVVRGEMTRLVRGGKTIHSAGDMWFHNLWEPHGWEIKTVPTEVAVLIAHPQALQQLRFPEAPEFSFLHPFTAPPLQRPQVPVSRRPEVLGLCAQILGHQDSSSPLKSLQLRVLLMRLILLACEDWVPPQSDPFLRRALPESIEPSIRLVAESRRFIAVRNAARACGLSVKAFRAAFTTLMGISFPKYALKYRVDGVALQLLKGNESVKAIAVDWGFTDTSHLDHSFQRFYGCFPTEYRARYRL